MIDPLTCPECGSDEHTERLGASNDGDTIEETYDCHEEDCMTQYTVTYEANSKTTNFTGATA